MKFHSDNLAVNFSLAFMPASKVKKCTPTSLKRGKGGGGEGEEGEEGR